MIAKTPLLLGQTNGMMAAEFFGEGKTSLYYSPRDTVQISSVKFRARYSLHTSTENRYKRRVTKSSLDFVMDILAIERFLRIFSPTVDVLPGGLVADGSGYNPFFKEYSITSPVLSYS